MKKGIGPVILIIIIPIVLIVEGVVVSTVFKKERLELRQLLEASLISKSDKVETYVRSFMGATDLSSVQGLDAFGTSQIVLPYDFDSTYHRTYNMSYWQIYDTKLIPPREVLLNKTRQKTAWVSSCYLENYMKSYDSFSEEVRMSGAPRLTVGYITDSTILVKLSDNVGDLEATLSGEFGWEGETSEIDIKRHFRPYSLMYTEFGKIVETAENIIYDDTLGKLIRNETPGYYHDMSSQAMAQDELDKLANDLLDSNMRVILKIPDANYNYAAGSAAAIINVTIYDSSMNYTLYDFPTDRVTVKYLGVNFLVKVGDTGLISNADEEEAQNLPEFRSCASDLGIISPKSNICDFFNGSDDVCNPKTCNDPDSLSPNKYSIEGTCEDFTGEYTDLCFDSDADGITESLYEYDCYSTSEICYYIEYRCGSDNCTDGGCIIACTSDPDCDDGKICTGVEAFNGIDKCMNPGDDDAYCENPPLPDTYIPPNTDGIWGTEDDCDRMTRTCPIAGDCTQNCQGVGDTWMCDGPPDTECINPCDGFGNCDVCTPPACAQEDCGCNDDTYCVAKFGPGYKCKLSTHQCTLDECDSVFDCTDPKTDCQYWTCDRPLDPDSECILNNHPDTYIPPGNTCGEDERSCPGECKDIKFEYRDPVGATVKCARECDGSGGCKPSCTPPDCSYTSIEECLYGCKNTINCWQGYYCPAKTCGDTCCLACIGTSCTTWSGCLREDMAGPQTCTWTDKWDDLGCLIFGCGPGEWCEWPCCVTDRTCTETCSYSDMCTYA